MNKIYKVIWSKVKHQYVVVSELAHSNGKQSRTSRNSIRSRIAALVVCGAIAAFGVFSALPNSAYAATAAETTSGQYIAVALADTNEEDVAGQWYNKNSTKFGNDYEWNSLGGRWVECDNTRTFKDATGALHTYTKQTINNKTYWVREGYSISAEEGNRFTAYDEHRNPIAPENTYIIDSQKSDDADDVGLISSSQVVISDDSKHTTLTGNPLNNIEPGIYGGASNGGGTEVPVDYHYYIDNNGKGWVNIGKQEWNDFTNPNSGKGYFQEVYAQKDGSYNTKEDGSGISVSSEYLYAIDKTSTGSSDKSDVKLGAFFNSNGTLYTGNVYGNNNEVLMTGVENGTYYSYWGTKINDLNTSLSEMTVGDLNRIVGGINDTIYTAQGDDIKQVSVQKSQDNNGGTIGLIRRGDWNGTTYSKIDPVPGTITVTSTGGTDGSGANNDVKIKFSNTDEDGTEHSFTVDAGSKVEGLKDGNTANPDDTLTGIKINGETYQLGGGKTYSPGQGIAISDDDNKISVRLKVGETNLTVDDTGLALNKDLTVDSVNAKGTTIDKKGLTVGGTTYVSAEGLNAGNKVITNVANGTSTYDAVNFSQLETVQNAENYVKAGSIDNASGTITLNRVQGGDVTISGLQDYVNEKDSYVTAAKLEGNKLTITQNNQGKEFSIDLSGLTSGLSGTDYQLVENPTNGSGGKYTVDDNGNLTLTVKDLNNPNAATKPITITGLAKKTDVAVVHGKYREGEANNLVDTNAQIGDEAIGVEKSSSIALGNGAFVSVQNGRKADAILFGSDTYTGGIAIGENSKALNATVNIGVKDYKGKMGDVDLSDYKTYEAMGVGETSIGSNSYISGSLSTNIGSYNITTTKYGNTSGILGSLYSAQNFGSVIVGTLNSIESNSSSAGMTSGVANSVIGMANKTQNSNGSLVFGTGNEITNSTASIPSPSSVSGDVADVAENFRDSVSDRNKSNGGAVLAIGGGNKADYAQNSQLIGVQNEVTGTSKDISEFNMVNGYQNTVTNGSNDTVIGTKNTVTNSDSNVVLGDNHAVQDADNNVILGSSDKETTHTASDTVVIGHNAQANGNNDVAIGSGSIANRAVGTEGYAGANPIGTVSVGSEGNERTITNVAAGRINEDSTDAVNGSQLYATNQKVDAGWTATDGTNDIKVNPKDGTTTLKFAGDNNIAVTADTTNKAIQVALNDKVYLGGDHTEDSHNIVLDGDRGVIGLGSTIALDGRDGTAVIGGVNITTTAEEGTGKLVSTINGLSNTTWTGTTETPNRAATEGQLQNAYDGSVKYWRNEDGTYDKSFIQLEGGEEGTTITHLKDGVVAEYSTEAINGSQLWETQQQIKDVETTANKHTIVSTTKDSNLTVKNVAGEGEADNYQVALKDDITLKGDSSSIELNGTKGTMQVNQETTEGTDFTNINGNVVSIGYTNKEGTKNAIVIDGGKGTITGLSNTTWDGKTDNASRVATEGQLEDLSDTVNTGWIATDSQNHEVNITPDNNKLNFAGDENITVTAANNEIKVALNDDIVLGDYLNGDDGVLIGGSSGTISATNSITVGEDQGLIIDGQKKEIQGLSNTTWNEKIANDAAVEGSTAASTAATQGQLQEVSKVANAGWTASDGTNSISVKPNETLNFVGDENLTVSADGTDKELKVSLNDDITLGDGENAIKIDGTNGTLNIGSTFVVAEDGTVLSDGDVIADADGEKYSLSEVGKYAVRYDKTNDGTSTITLVDGDDLSGTRIKNVADGVDPKDAVNVSQLEAVEATANAGWTASDGTNSISIKPNETLNFVGDENLTVSADGTDKKLKVSLNDNITLGNGQSAITLNGSPENSNDPALSVGTDKFVVDQDGSLSVSDKFNVDAETGNIYAANNSGSAIMMNDDSVALNAGGNGIAISDEGILLNTNGFDEDIKLVTKGTSVSVDSNGTTFTNVNTNETTNIDGGTINVGDRLMVEDDGSIYATNNNGSTVMINDNGVALNSEGNGVVVSGEGITLNTNGSAVTVDRFNGTTFTNTNTGETTNINGGTITTNTVKGLDNTTWSEDLAEEVANNEELQGTAATQGQLQQAVNEVAEVANAGWNAKAGGNTINVKPNETLNFEGDGNITVSATDGTSNELKFGLNDNITLGDKTSTSITLYTDPTSETTVVGTDGNTTNVTGYVPESYKSGTGADFVKNNGGFALFTTDTQGHGIFGVTTKGTAHGKDFVTYTKDIYNNSVQYSLNDVGNIVTQISHAVFDEGVGNTGMEYTLISDFEDEADKDSPFDAKEGKTRTIGLAVRQDGAVIVGAVVNDEGISSDRGIRINAETKTTYDENDNEVTNNIATITGLENTEWKPPTPVATFAANDGSATVTSRAATESQLNDLYSAVAAYDVNVDGTIDYSHIALAGTPYGASRSGNGTHTGGTSITNVAYASGKDGSEAVNVDYLNDAINNAVKDGGAISDSDRHLQEGTYHVNDQGKVELIVADEKGENQSTVTIDNIANKNDITNLDNKIDNTFNDLNDKINNIDNVETDVKGGNINEDGTISLKTENEDGTTTNVTLKGQLTDSGVVQEGTSFDKETGTITITSQDKYSGETSSVKVEGIASTDVVGATNKEDLATAYKDADKDGNATTEYITDSESMVEADVALDHAIQDVAGTSYANDMVLSNRIDSVEKRLGNVEERIDKVGAMAAAIANLRTMGFDPEAPTEIAIGVGQYKSETGIAIGVFHYPNQDFMLSASLSSSGDELMGGIGATWKLGRKSAAERAKDEEARHLEQAEEMKKLAQQEKVKAQAQRHAKLLAERQQASQKNA